MLTDEDVIAELRVSDEPRLQKFEAVIAQIRRERSSPAEVVGEVGFIESDAKVQLDEKFGR
jgi:hypothetical protein